MSPTNRSARDWVYVSKRLTREILDQETARKRRRAAQVSGRLSLGVAQVGADLQNPAPDRANLIDMAMRATEAVSERTGPFDPEVRSDYVLLSADFRYCVAEVLMPTMTFGLMIAEPTEDWGLGLVVLIGSSSNFLGRYGDPAGTGWHPSTLAGMTQIAISAMEPEDQQRLGGPYPKETEPVDFGGSLDTVERTAELFSNLFHKQRTQHRFLEVPARPHYDVARTGGWDAILVGAPIWAATHEAVPLMQR